jgi:hypothetical protein
MLSSQPHYKALHTPWCHVISDFCRVSLAEYLLVLRILLPLVTGVFLGPRAMIVPYFLPETGLIAPSTNAASKSYCSTLSYCIDSIIFFDRCSERKKINQLG